MSGDPQRLDALAGSVVDGQPVDWTGVESSTTDADELAHIRALGQVAQIAEFNRTLQRSADSPMRAEPGASLEPTRWGDLLLLDQVGAGASGAVWRVWDARLQREVALKLLVPHATGAEAPTAGSPLLAEARALASVRHPNVVTVHGIAEHDGRVGVWMEFLRGATLAAEIERRGALPAETVRELGIALCQALGAIHAAGLVHGDVKPANIVLEASGRVVLADLGLGVRRFRAEREPQRISGTPMFLAPERLDGEPASPRSDLYARGRVLRWALTGRAPYAARTLSELKAEVRRPPARALADESPQAPESLRRAIDRAMAPVAEARFANADEMAGGLAAPIERAAAASAPDAAGARRFGAGSVLALLGATVLLAAVAWVATHRPAARDAGPIARATAPVGGGTQAVRVPVYDVGATIVRRSGGGYQRLASGDRVSPGDRLSLEFRASEPAYVYVLDEDERGQSYLLFPQPLFDRANPLPPDSTLVLPGSVGGHEHAWTVTSRGGREHFLVVASLTPVAEIEAELSRLPAARPGRPIVYANVPAEVRERLRGVGGVEPLPESGAPHRAGAFARIEALAGRETGVHGVWVREVTLENPAR